MRTTAHVGIVLGIVQWSIVIRTIDHGIRTTPWKRASAPEHNGHLYEYFTLKMTIRTVEHGRPHHSRHGMCMAKLQ